MTMAHPGHVLVGVSISCLPFTPKFLQINSPRGVFFCIFFFCNFYGNSWRPPIFSVTLMCSSGSRVDWKIFFVIVTKLLPRKIFCCIANILVLMVLWAVSGHTRNAGNPALPKKPIHRCMQHFPLRPKNHNRRHKKTAPRELWGPK